MCSQKLCNKVLNTNQLIHIFTGHNEVVAKVIFLQASVCPQGGLPQCMSGYQPPRRRPSKKESPPRRRTPEEGEPPSPSPKKENPPRRRTPPEGEPPKKENPPRRRTPPESRRSMSSRYASYWNAFLCEDGSLPHTIK